MPSEYRPGNKMVRVSASLRDPTVALKQIGAVLTAESQDSFRQQKHGSKKWNERAPVNVFGILADFAAGKEPPKRRFDRRPALMDTGRLASSISWHVIGDVVEVGTTVEYAAKHHYGGEVESVKITETMQQAIAKWLKKTKKARAAGLGWLLNRKFTGKKLTQKVPARPFVGLTKESAADVRQIIGQHIMEAE